MRGESRVVLKTVLGLKGIKDLSVMLPVDERDSRAPTDCVVGADDEAADVTMKEGPDGGVKDACG